MLLTPDNVRIGMRIRGSGHTHDSIVVETYPGDRNYFRAKSLGILGIIFGATFNYGYTIINQVKDFESMYDFVNEKEEIKI